MTDRTPIDRTAEALCTADTSYWHHEQTDDYPCSSCVEKANTAVSAALTDDTEPYWLENLLAESYPAGHIPSDRKTYLAHKAALRNQAAALRAEILGDSE